MKLFDVYGGQPTPTNFDVSIFPLSRSFDEGMGRDVVFYQDLDVCNFLSSSRVDGEWYISGANLGGDATGSVDYISNFYVGAMNINAEKTQHFVDGTENLFVDVTDIVSATVNGHIPDSGFRVSLSSTHENDLRTYFVKRFASRNAYDRSKRPQLIVKYDDSIADDSANLTFNTNCNLFVNNFSLDGSSTNFVSGTSQLTGSNCIALKLTTLSTGGYYSLYFTGSQHNIGKNYLDGTYVASINLDITDMNLFKKLSASGSVDFTPVWTSLDGKVTFHTGSKVYAKSRNTSSKVMGDVNYTVNVNGLIDEYTISDTATLRVNIFDESEANIKLFKTPYIPPTSVVRKTYYAVRDIVTNEIVIPFDEQDNSTICSSDVEGMFFRLDMSALTSGRSYAIDVLINKNGAKRIYKSASPTFKIR
jgi:hypothetical protein